MSIKKVKYTYRGLNQDFTRSKHPFEFYYSANNIRIVSTDSQTTGSLYNEKGNSLVVTLPTISVNSTTKIITYGSKTLSYQNEEINTQIGTAVSGVNKIIGYGLTRDGIILFSTDGTGFDAIWKVKNIFEDSYELELSYLRNLGFSINFPIQSIFNYETSIIQKIYWVDGQNQMRFLNLEQSIANGDLEELIDVLSTSTDVTGKYSLSQPIIPQITQGGTHTSGMIQYAYNLYKLNGSQTVISPLSELIPLDFGNGAGGGEINEIVGASPLVEIADLDTNYTHIKLYAIKYTSFNQEPSISVIVDEEIASFSLFNHFDDGSVVETISLDEFLFLGSSVFIPKHIETKDNRMFAASIIDDSFDFEIDARAYSHTSGSVAKVLSNVTVIGTVVNGNTTTINTTTYSLDSKHDSINPDYSLYKYQKDGVTLGGEGKFIKYEIKQKTLAELTNQDLRLNKFFKGNEIYRIGIQFYNSLGQTSQPFWIADLKAPTGNLEGLYNTLKVDIKSTEYDAYIASLGLTEATTPVGYKIIRADREINDKTVVAQGVLTGMMCQTTRDVKNYNYWKISNNRKEESNSVSKQPIIFARGRNSYQGVVSPTSHLFHMNEDPSFSGDGQEIFREDDTDFKRQQTWQYTKMMQMHSPDLLFDSGVSLNPTLELRIVGVAGKTQSNVWHYRVNKNSGNKSQENKISDYSNFERGDTIVSMYGLFGPSRDDDNDETTHMTFKQYYHELTTFSPATSSSTYKIYGKPELTIRGQDATDYNNDPQFKYINSLENFLTDRKKWSGNSNKNEDAITTINSYGAQCATFVMGTTGQSVDSRTTLEELWSLSGVASNATNDAGLLLAEFAFPNYYLYAGNIYGGNTYEDKSRSSYIEIGSYQDITETSIQIDSPGDTFVQIYKVARINKTENVILDSTAIQLTEIIEFKVETTVNLKNRNDNSLGSWDSNLQPVYAEYHNYNRVYSQSPNLVQSQADSFKFKKTNSFDTQIIASKVKIPGESIDSWTDFLENETMDLDGKYGGINALVNFRDEIYALQDTGVAHITINPRVQVQGADGIDLELGKGDILYDYEYISTTTGTLNKWGICKSPTGFYFLDILNKSWNKFTGQGIINLADAHGLHSFFSNNIDYSLLKTDNPLLGLGASAGYDFKNSNSYLTIKDGVNDFTINFNEKTNSVESFHDFIPSMYISKGSKMVTTSPDINSLYEHDKGPYQTFYGTKYPSTITLMVNPESDLDCVFNNIEYKSELYINDIDQPASTLTHISAYNEYQDSGRIALTVPTNIQRKFRQWRAQIPRNANSRDRIRNPWIFLVLELDTVNDSKLVLHDLIVNYTI